jgi:hypothetical protein
MSGFGFSDVANIFMSLYGLGLLPAQFRFVIINIRYAESHVHLADRCGPSKFANGVDSLVLQALKFQKWVSVANSHAGQAYSLLL